MQRTRMVRLGNRRPGRGRRHRSLVASFAALMLGGVLVLVGQPSAVAQTPQLVYLGMNRVSAYTVPFDAGTSVDATADAQLSPVLHDWNFAISNPADSETAVSGSISATSSYDTTPPTPYVTGPSSIVPGGALTSGPLHAVVPAAPGFSSSRTVNPLVIPPGGGTQSLTVQFTADDASDSYGGMGLIIEGADLASDTWTFNSSSDLPHTSVVQSAPGAIAVGVHPLVVGTTYTLTFTGHVANNTTEGLASKPRVGFLAEPGQAAGDPVVASSYTINDSQLDVSAAFVMDQAYELHPVAIWSFGVNYLSGAVSAPVSVPVTRAECKDGGWRRLVDDQGRPFKNQGDCVSYVATGGRNKAAG